MSSCGNPATEQDALMTRRQKFDKSKTCVKCKEHQGHIVIRHAVYCKTCFFPLVSTRFRKVLGPTINPARSAAKAANVRGGRLRGRLEAPGSLLIGFSGGLGSTALLDLVAKSYFYRSSSASAPPPEAAEDNSSKGSEHPSNKSREDGESGGVWKGKPAVCYVEVASILPGARDRTEDVRAIVQSYCDPASKFEIDFIPLRLEDAFDKSWWKTVGGSDIDRAAEDLGINISNENLPINTRDSSSTPLESLHTYLSSLPTPTAVHSAISSLIRVLLIYTAASREASHLLLGSTLTSLSVNMISGIAQGAGFAMVSEGVEEAWKTKDQSIRIVRPLRDIGIKESAFWSYWSNLRIVGRERYPTAVSPVPNTGDESVKVASAMIKNQRLTSIDALTQDFIMGLEKDYPSTVSTIARTIAKVTTKEKGVEGGCVVCQRPAQPNVQQWKASISIRSYHDEAFVNSKHPLPPHFTAPPTLDEVEAPSTSPLPISTHELAPRLCYACHTTFTSRSSRGSATTDSVVVPLPEWVKAIFHTNTGTSATVIGSDDEAGELQEEHWRKRQVTQNEMKEQIGQFLLDDTGPE